MAADFFVFSPLKSSSRLQWKVKGKENGPGSEVKNMYRNYADSGGAQVNAAGEEIRVLIAISLVSARLARNLTILAANSQPEEGGKTDVKHGRDGSDHQRASRCRRYH
jgi:hypothetical protein